MLKGFRVATLGSLGLSKMRGLRVARFIGIVGVLGIVVVATMAAWTNVPTTLTIEDVAVFESELDLRRPAIPLTYGQELALIRSVQDKVWTKAPFGIQIPLDQEREPRDLIRAGQGSCFDISRTYDKAFAYLGFKSRHVYLLYRGNRTFVDALFRYRQPSHAVTEVLTAKGWLFVDSNTPWIAVTKSGDPVNADGVWNRTDDFDVPPPTYLRDPWWAIRGMYSRKGTLYSPYFIFPQLNWPDFIGWLIELVAGR